MEENYEELKSSIIENISLIKNLKVLKFLETLILDCVDEKEKRSN